MVEETTEIKDINDIDPKSLLGKNTYVHLPSGLGKTRFITKLIEEFIIKKENPLRIMICMDRHDLISEFINKSEDLLKSVKLSHFEGKTRPLMCIMNDPNEKNQRLMCYGCKFYKECMYQRQFRRAKEEKIPLIFIVKQHFWKVAEYKPYVLIVDETIESLVRQFIEVPKNLEHLITFERIENCQNCPCLNLPCEMIKKKKEIESRGKKFSCIYQMIYKNVKIDKFFPMNQNERYFMYQTQNSKEIYGTWDFYLKKYILLGYKPLKLKTKKWRLPTLIFNCATTLSSVAEKTFQRKFDTIYTSNKELKNKVYIINDMMFLSESREELNDLPNFIKLFNIPKEQKILIWTKKVLENQIKQMLPNVKVGHYGASRGTNLWEDHDIVISWGRFAIRLTHENLLRISGYTQNEVQSINISEELQAIMRVRLLNDPNKRAFIFSRTLLGNPFFENAVILDKTALGISIEILERIEELEGFTKSKIYTKLKHHQIPIKKALGYLIEFGHINKDIIEKKRGGRLLHQIKK